jgi:hypothetical protein
MAIAARLNPMAAHRQRFGERDEGGLGAAEGPCFGRRAVEGDAVIRHHHMRHHPCSITGARGAP